MSWTLRIVLVLISVLVTGAVIGRIKRSKMQTEDAIFWVIFSFVLIILAVCPPILFFFTRLLGIESPANLLFLAVIGVLFLKVFSMSIRESQLEEKIRKLSADLALKDLEDREREAVELMEIAELMTAEEARKKAAEEKE